MVVIFRLIGAITRGILVALLIAIPALLLPGIGRGAQEITMMLSMLAGAVIIVEYASAYPGLVEFRFAPPFNRLRFLSLFLTVIALSLIFQADVHSSWTVKATYLVGDTVGRAMDFPLSPVRIVSLLIAEDPDSAEFIQVRAGAGVAYTVALVMLALFTVILRALGWPFKTGVFNVWVNLPTLDWSTVAEVEDRLAKDGQINIIMGFTFPFALPLVFSKLSDFVDLNSVGNDQAVVWVIAIWAFLPASLFMRGIAMNRISRLIHRKREQLHVAETSALATA
jgi:hypothetical protein